MKPILILALTIYPLAIFSQNSETLIQTKALIDKENYQEALTILNIYLVQDTTNFDAYYQRAKCYRRAGNYKNAFEDLFHAIRLNNKFAPTYTELGTVYVMNKQYQSALESYSKAIELDSLFQPTYSNRGSLYFYFMDRDSEALLDLTKSIELDSTDQFSRYNRGLLYDKIGQYSLALSDLNLSLKFHPNDHLVLNERAICYSNLKEYDNAIKDYFSAIKYNNEIDPYEKLNNGKIYYSIADCYLSMNKGRKAKKYFKKAKKLGIE